MGAFRSLRNIINALSRATIPVLNAFGVLAIVTCVYAVVGSSLYGEVSPDKFYTFSAALFTVFTLPELAGTIRP